ncbi:hypothetical protein QBZ16_004180 [Prototheca wickerhamii]|uniref:RING-type E3 ubiquitin transferase n=1 Tax=Prototheca wickerhamii TaxID=3111 RepID=A0AAD9IIF6_PROWI|nr:hypothetical protein QBZ16_004180 [Prototheca wickerhamii]
MKQILAIQRDPTLSDAEKAVKRQALMSGKWASPATGGEEQKEETKSEPENELAGTLQCSICHELCNRPVTAICQHNFCLKCFQDHINKSKKKCCPTCRTEFSAKFCANPRINTALAVAIRAFKIGAPVNSNKPFERIKDSDRPDEAFTTDRAVRAGRANAASGRIMVSIPNDHFGPIPASADPRGTGIKVGEWWKDRLDCRQWGAHFPHVAGIAGQSNAGAQSVVLSGGYEDDRDEGEWFLYTGSGGRDLSGNKRTNKVQSFDQTFENMNKALKLSCLKGLPVRVVRSFKEKRSAYAPSDDTPVRYDGVYRIVRCWRKPGTQGPLVCRYLFVRCDNEPAPWSSEDTGDRPSAGAQLPAEALEEMKLADRGQVFSMCDKPWWGWLADKEEWGWTKPPPESQHRPAGESSGPKTARKRLSEQEKALREFACGICKKTVVNPVSTPCGHNFCKSCLDERFAGVADEIAGGGSAVGVRSMRARKQLKPCPVCATDLMEFLRSAQVNRDMAEVVRKLQESVRQAKADAEAAAAADGEEAGGDKAEEEEQDESEADKPEEESTEAESAQAEEALNAAPLAGPDSTDSALVAHQMETSAQASPAKGPNRGDATSRCPPETKALIEEFSDFDAGLIEALLEQEDGDVAAVKYALRKMRAQVEAEAKKRQKQTQLTSGDKATAVNGQARAKRARNA